MKVLDLLKGKKVKVMTDAKVPVELIIESAEEKHHAEDIGPSTPENDWWPDQRQWTTIEVKFTNGHHKSYSRIDDIEIINL